MPKVWTLSQELKMQLKCLSSQTIQTIIQMKKDAISERIANPEAIAFTQTPNEIALKSLIEQLNKNEKAELQALMWVGRRAISGQVVDFDKLLKRSERNLDDVGDYVGSNYSLVAYLEKGLEVLNLGKHAG
jgi:hypothetical protein